MARQYHRKYELHIIPTDGDSKVIRDLRIKFNVNKSLLSTPNLCKLELINPNQSTLAVLSNKFTKILLNVGYGDDLLLLFTGEVRNLKHSKTSVERTITIFAGDGEQSWQNSIFNKTYSASVQTSVVIEDIVKSFGDVLTGSLEGLPEVADKIMGQTLSGSSRDILDMFATEYGFTWGIQDSELVITPDKVAASNKELVVVSPLTGMIDSPTITEIGVDVITLLNPRLTPNAPFKVDAEGADLQLGDLRFRRAPRNNATGLYKVRSTEFIGDSYEGNWLSKVSGELHR